jgi:hypothetical protein
MNLFKEFNIKNTDKLLEIQWKWENKKYVRIILPKWSYIYTDKKAIQNNKTNLIEYFTKLKNGEIVKNSFKYEIKNKDCNNYNFWFIKQPWIKNYNLNYKFINSENKVIKINKEKLEKDFNFYIEK